MKWLVVLIALAACKENDEMLPLNPGGGGGTGSGTQPDAADTSSDGGTMISGRVCYLLSNVHTLGTCAPEQGNFVVTLGSSMAFTAIDGTFTIMRPASTIGLYWTVARGLDVVSSAVKFGNATTLPVLNRLAYEDMVSATQPTVGPNSAALIARVTRAGAPVTGATVAAQPVPYSSVYYDGQTDVSWEQDASTGPFGVAWIPSTPTGPTEITISAGTTPTVLTGFSVGNATVTFVFAEIP
jgi:hypothetical protein